MEADFPHQHILQQGYQILEIIARMRQKLHRLDNYIDELESSNSITNINLIANYIDEQILDTDDLDQPPNLPQIKNITDKPPRQNIKVNGQNLSKQRNRHSGLRQFTQLNNHQEYQCCQAINNPNNQYSKLTNQFQNYQSYNQQYSNSTNSPRSQQIPHSQSSTSNFNLHPVIASSNSNVANNHNQDFLDIMFSTNEISYNIVDEEVLSSAPYSKLFARAHTSDTDNEPFQLFKANSSDRLTFMQMNSYYGNGSGNSSGEQPSDNLMSLSHLPQRSIRMQCSMFDATE